MAVASFNSKLVKELSDKGIIPPQTTKFELIVEVKQAVKLRIERFATEEEYDEILTAVKNHSNELERAVIVRRIEYEASSL